MAAANVLGTYELLEAILIHVPPKQIFVVQSISSAWRDVFTRSTPVRQLCFIEPSSLPVRPSLQALEMLRPAYASHDIKINTPVLSRQQYSTEADTTYDVWSTYTPTGQIHTDTSIVSERSCRELYLTQPPCTAVAVRTTQTSCWERILIEMDIYCDEQDVKVGEAEDWIRETVLGDRYNGIIDVEVLSVEFHEMRVEDLSS